ncbi:uncharacterized protein [Nicotiana tomentosiformis]|uniref:uncharacterized protein n=1 Tax=Nicotiana tomentosiformis TaxID=4098 RepID=UPI00388C49B7
MDVIKPIELAASNGHGFIFVAIDYFTNNATNLISDLMKEICEKFRIVHRYRTTMRTSIRATPYMLVYDTKAVIPAEVEIPSLRVIQEAKLDDTEWIWVRKEQLMLIDEKIMDAVCHDQLYQNRIASAFNKRVNPHQFTPWQLVLKNIFPHQEEAKGKFAPNWQGPYVVHRVLSG